MKKSVRKCQTEGCNEKHYGRGWCSKCYWIHSKAGDLDSMEEVVAIPPPPKPPVDKKRCHATVNGKRCIRGIRASHMCSAHWKEACDKSACELRERPFDATHRDWEGKEAELIAMQEKRADVR
jgi:hypothetical protein